MTDKEFYQITQELWFQEFVDSEVSEIREHTQGPQGFQIPEEWFLEDVPF